MSKAMPLRSLGYALIIVIFAVGVLLTGCPKQPSAGTSPVQTPSPVSTTYATPTPSTPGAAGKPQTAANPKQMTDLEKKHVPQFALPQAIKQGEPMSVTVNVGQVPHPMKPEHYIQWVELYLDGTLVKKVDLKPGDKPMATFEITPTAGVHTLKADINCNIHGLWENIEEITAATPGR